MNTSELTAYYISSIVGVGILTTPVIAYQMAGSYSVIAWIILMITAIPFAGLFAYIAVKKPHASGVGEFIKNVFGHSMSKSIVLLTIVTMAICNPVMGMTSARYLGDVIPAVNNHLLIYGYGFMLLSIAFNFFGVNVGAKIQSLLLAILTIGLLALICLSIPHVDWKHIEFINPTQNIQPIGQAMIIGFFSFLGWDNVCCLAEDIKNPRRTFTISVIIAIIVVGMLYIGIAISYAGLVTEANKSNTLISVILEATIGNSKVFGNVLALSLMILATNAWVLGAAKLISSLDVSFLKSSKGSLLCLTIMYGLTLLLLYSNNGLENILIELAGANFFIVYIVSFLAIIVFASKAGVSKNKLVITASIISIVIVFIMMSFIANYFIALALAFFAGCLIMAWLGSTKLVISRKQLRSIPNN